MRLTAANSMPPCASCAWRAMLASPILSATQGPNIADTASHADMRAKMARTCRPRSSASWRGVINFASRLSKHTSRCSRSGCPVGHRFVGCCEVVLPSPGRLSLAFCRIPCQTFLLGGNLSAERVANRRLPAAWNAWRKALRDLAVSERGRRCLLPQRRL